VTEVWFTADLHFGHKGILKHHPDRPGAAHLHRWNDPATGIAVMEDHLIEAWNAVVSRGDDVWVLGDFSFGTPEEKAKVFHRLAGRKHLIVGNHDNNATKRLPWTSVSDLHTWKAKPHRAVLCHYPLLTWDRAHYGVWMLHGHSHGLLQPHHTTRMDVGVDCHPMYRPFHLDEIGAVMAKRAYEPVDAHSPEDPR
jgi:calcineurin-like phosphoesterase family protein